MYAGLSDRDRAKKINQTLAKLYPDAKTLLDHSNALELLLATILAAQCTDKLVNEVTPGLFKRYPTAKDFADADPKKLEQEILTTGFFRQKTKAVIGTCRAIVERHGGKVPDTMEDLTSLPGVGRKTANVVLGSCFGKPAIVVDTHVRRLAQRLGFSETADPDKIEIALQKLLPEKEWTAFSHRVSWYGRQVCFARRPAHDKCKIAQWCPSVNL